MFCAGLSMAPPELFGAKRQTPNWQPYYNPTPGGGVGICLRALSRPCPTQADRPARSGQFLPAVSSRFSVHSARRVNLQGHQRSFADGKRQLDNKFLRVVVI